MELGFTDEDLESMLEKLRAFADTLEPGERAALNLVGLTAAAALDPEVKGFSIIPGGGLNTGGQIRPAGASSGGGGSGGGSSSGGGFPDVAKTPAAPSPLPIPYPNLGRQLGSRFPF